MRIQLATKCDRPSLMPSRQGRGRLVSFQAIFGRFSPVSALFWALGFADAATHQRKALGPKLGLEKATTGATHTQFNNMHP